MSMVEHEDERDDLEEVLAEPTTGEQFVESDGIVIGNVAGLVWSDYSGLDIVGVQMNDAQIAVPVPRDSWRGMKYVEIELDPKKLTAAPTLGELKKKHGAFAIRAVSDFYSVELSGPPPGPGTGQLPPWWYGDTATGSYGGPAPAGT
jgi:hypothetical protein